MSNEQIDDTEKELNLFDTDWIGWWYMAGIENQCVQSRDLGH
jgi:hypothetical protein